MCFLFNEKDRPICDDQGGLFGSMSEVQ